MNDARKEKYFLLAASFEAGILVESCLLNITSWLNKIFKLQVHLHNYAVNNVSEQEKDHEVKSQKT